MSDQRLSHWIVEAISVAYSCVGLQALHGLRAHSTWSMTTSRALFRGVSVQLQDAHAFRESSISTIKH